MMYKCVLKTQENGLLVDYYVKVLLYIFNFEPLYLKVASRRVFQCTGLILLVCGIIGKFGAVLTLIPDPIIGGTLTIVFGFVAAAGISTLQYIDMSSTRNLCILAVSLILGLMVPQWLEKNPGAINTGMYEYQCGEGNTIFHVYSCKTSAARIFALRKV